MRAHLDAPRRHDSLAGLNGNWLFPGHLPGQPITPARLGARLGQHGIDAQTGHRAAMLQLASTVPAAVLVDLLGIHTTTAADWTHVAGGDWSNYAAEIARTRAYPTPNPGEMLASRWANVLMSSTTRDRDPDVTVTAAGSGDAFGSAGNLQARIVLASTRIGQSR